MADKLNQDAADVAADLAALKDDIARLTATVASLVEATASDAAGTVRERVRAVAGDAQDAAEQVKASGKAALHEAKTRTAGAVDEVAGRIERNPLTAVAIALGLGVVVGLFTGRD